MPFDRTVSDGTARTNLEFKARLSCLEAARRSAAELGAAGPVELFQVDTYFPVPHGRLKLREIRGVECQLIAYDRREDTAERWSLFRVTPVSDARGMKAVLTDTLGRRGVVTKRRQVFLYQDCRIHLDEVEHLGTFIEFEVMSRGAANDDHARLDALKRAFGLTDAEALKASYADLLGF